jgi:hypothetical protein
MEWRQIGWGLQEMTANFKHFRSIKYKKPFLSSAEEIINLPK